MTQDSHDHPKFRTDADGGRAESPYSDSASRRLFEEAESSYSSIEKRQNPVMDPIRHPSLEPSPDSSRRAKPGSDTATRHPEPTGLLPDLKIDFHKFSSALSPNNQTVVTDQGGNVTSIADKNQETWRFSYANGKVSSIEEPSGYSLKTGPDGKLHEYDSQGNATGNVLNEQFIPDGAGAISIYNNDSRATTVMKQDGTTEQFDKNGYLTSTTDQAGATTTIKYRADGTVAEIDAPTVSYKRNSNGQYDEYQGGRKIDTFTSIRVGSDGSYQLRHDDKNQYTIVDATGDRTNSTDSFDSGYPSPPVVVKRLGASDAFARSVGYEASTLPSYELQKISAGGFSYVAAGTVSDGLPGSSDSTNSVAGLTDPNTKQIIIPERSSAGDGMNTYHVNPDAQGVIRHESGHAFDFSTGDPSQQQNFIDTYNSELKALPPAVRKQFDSEFIENESDGDATPATRREVYAESVATVTGGNGEPNDMILQQYFPKTLAIVNSQVYS